MKISKDLQWLLPFINTVEKMYPKVKKLEAIRKMRFSYNTRDRAYGEITSMTDGSYKISLRIDYQLIHFFPLTVTKMPFSKIDILVELAHELAHLYHWKHTPEHKILENEILTAFMFKLKAQGYISEEKELGE